VFSSFRRIPLDRSRESNQKLMAIVQDRTVPNWEIWLRAIWIATTNPNSSISWSNIEMIRELHSVCDHLIAPVASPEDAEAFYSEYDTRPVQLLFAKRSGGKQRYRATYNRLLQVMPLAKWLEEEYVAMQEAATYFGDTATAKTLGETLQKLRKPMKHSFVLEQFKVASGLSSLGAYGLTGSIPFPTSPMPYLPLATTRFFFPRTLTPGLPRLNPYLSGAAELFRWMKTIQTQSPSNDYLLSCLDLPVDVQIELMDSVRAQPPDKQDPAFVKKLEFPVDRMGKITLDSLAAARRVAQWLGDDKALREIDHRILQDAPALQS
jgi:hypothetical protein